MSKKEYNGLPISKDAPGERQNQLSIRTKVFKTPREKSNDVLEFDLDVKVEGYFKVNRLFFKWKHLFWILASENS